MSSAIASCSSGFSYLTNDKQQSPCSVAAWLLGLSLGEGAQQSVPPLTSPSYTPPADNILSVGTCSWAFYNTIQACAVCQGHDSVPWTTWSSPCDLVGEASTSTYWPSNITFSGFTSLPLWSIVNPTSWSSGSFNPTQAQFVANQQQPDATDTTHSQPSLSSSSPSSSSSSSSPSSSKSVPIGAIAGGVAGGVVFLLALALLTWYLLRRQRRQKQQTVKRRKRARVDLTADHVEDPLTGPPRASHEPNTSGSGSDFRPNSFAYSTVSMSSSGHFPQMQAAGAGAGVSTVYPAAALPPGAGAAHHLGQYRPVPTNTVSAVPRSAWPAGYNPSVAEQLQEKQRLRAETERARRAARRPTRPAPVPVQDDSPSPPGSDERMRAHTHSNSGGSSASSVPTVASTSGVKLAWYGGGGGGGDAGADRDDALSEGDGGESEAQARGGGESVESMLAQVPGARHATLRERQEPPPSYIRETGAAPRLTVVNEDVHSEQQQ